MSKNNVLSFVEAPFPGAKLQLDHYCSIIAGGRF